MRGDVIKLNVILRVEGLSKSYGKAQAVADVSFQVDAGESFGLLGPNGAGKSTTIKLLFGLLPPDSGTIWVDGRTLAKDPLAVKRCLGYVPQEVALYPELSAQENLRFWGRLYGLSGQELERQVAGALEIVGLSDRARGRVSTFSGGMKRRINIAAALLHEPKILIMDEPTVGIDPQSRNHILETVRSLNAQGMTIIYTSHYMEEVEYLCNRVGIIDRGRIIACGTVDELRQVVGEDAHLVLNVVGYQESLNDRLLALDEVKHLTVEGDQLTVVSAVPALALGAISHLLAEAGVTLRSVQIDEPNLEAVFLHLTGRALRD